MVDMTDEEVVEYVMMLSKDQEEKDQIAQEILEVQRLKEMEDWLLDEQTNGGEGSSDGAEAVRITNFVPEAASDKEREEEEALVQRAIEMSMLDMQELDEDRHRDHHGHYHDHDLHDHHHHHYTESEPNGSIGGILENQLHVHVPTSWDLSDIVNVDNHKASNNIIREDQSIVQSVLEELLDAEDALEANKAALRTNNDKSWPSIISKSSVSEEKDPQESELSTPSPARDPVPPLQQKMSWSQVARTTSASSLASSTGSQKQPSIIKTYRPRDEDEDEDTQLARILSLSMIEK